MISGDPSVFAIESGITQAYRRLSARALGFFVIYVAGERYGVFEPDATMLACSLDEVARRLAGRGTHTVPFGAEAEAGAIADAFRLACYADVEDQVYFGIPEREFRDLMYSKEIVWAPDGDEAFDDRSCVLQFDSESDVRLIAFRTAESGLHDPATLKDQWLDGEQFYAVLREWRDAFEAEWASLPKVAD
jgi:hypothetical protein